MSKQLIIIAAVLFLTASVFSQTSTFVYQGKLQDGPFAANGNYQFQFKLYDAPSSGNQVGQTLSDINATASNGIFAVNLDFGANAFDGGPRFLEISVRQNNVGQQYTQLDPREPVASAPYAVKSLKANEAATAVTANNALNLGGLAASEYVQGTDPRMADSRDPLPSSNYYIQNSTILQPASSFNISGEGQAYTFNAARQFNIGGNRVFHITGTENTFAGFEAGNSIGAGSFNAAFGTHAGKGTVTGINNSFFGAYAGRGNVSGGNNSFFGANAGLSNTGSFNSFVGSAAGFNNQTGSENTFVGVSAGQENTTGIRNVAIGRDAGKNNTIGSFNTYVGALSGTNNAPITGTSNTIVGYNASVAPTVSFATAIGESAFANQNNQVAIGSAASTVKISGQLNVSNDTSLSGTLKLSQLGGSGGVPLCRNAGNFISTCVADRPDEGLAELREQLRQQQAQIDALKAIVCKADPTSPVCIRQPLRPASEVK